MGQTVYIGFVNISQYGYSPVHIAIKCSISHSRLTFIGSIQYQISKFVGYGHQQISPDAGLNVFFGKIGRQSFKYMIQGFPEFPENLTDINDIIPHTQVSGKCNGISHRMVRGIL